MIGGSTVGQWAAVTGGVCGGAALPPPAAGWYRTPKVGTHPEEKTGDREIADEVGPVGHEGAFGRPWERGLFDFLDC